MRRSIARDRQSIHAWLADVRKAIVRSIAHPRKVAYESKASEFPSDVTMPRFLKWADSQFNFSDREGWCGLATLSRSIGASVVFPSGTSEESIYYRLSFIG
jgi:hypothetical protein